MIGHTIVSIIKSISQHLRTTVINHHIFPLITWQFELFSYIQYK